jgi:hypothetical protein
LRRNYLLPSALEQRNSTMVKQPVGGFDEPAAPVPVTPVSVTPHRVKSAFGAAPADMAGKGWIPIGRDAPASKAELAKREAAKYAPKGKR